MVNQKPISLKIDYQALELLEQEHQASGRKRNELINSAIFHYAEYLDLRERISYYSKYDLTEALKMAKGYLEKIFPWGLFSNS